MLIAKTDGITHSLTTEPCHSDVDLVVKLCRCDKTHIMRGYTRLARVDKELNCPHFDIKLRKSKSTSEHFRCNKFNIA